MRVGQRLFLAVLPAVLGVLLVAALGYWGQYQHRAPASLVVIAGIAAVVSLLLAWRNTRYVALRVERLAGSRSVPGTPVTDELESIERAVDHLSNEVTLARQEGARQTERAEADRVELTVLMGDVAERVAQRVEEVRLPLHILLENRFGDLNENQEEMLGAAQSAAEDVVVLLRRLRLIGDLERGSLELRQDAIRVGELLGALLPAVRADADRRQVQVDVDIAPALARVRGDRTHLQEAFALLLSAAAAGTDPGGVIRIEALPAPGGIRIGVSHGPEAARLSDRALAVRLLAALGARPSSTSDAVAAELPLYAADRVISAASTP